MHWDILVRCDPTVELELCVKLKIELELKSFLVRNLSLSTAVGNRKNRRNRTAMSRSELPVRKKVTNVRRLAVWNNHPG
jgi:hypothetical protein